MSKIQPGQLFAILMVSAAWSVLCIPEIGSGAQLLGIVLSMVLQMLLCIPMLLLAGQQFSLFRTAASGKWIGYIYILFFLLWGAHGFAQLWAVSSEISLPVSGRLTAAVLITLVCLYTCSLGLRTMARCAPFVMGLLLVTVIVLVLGAYKRVETVRFTMQTDGIFESTLSYFSMGGELAAAYVLLGSVKSGQKRAVLGYLAGKAALACLILFLCISAGGRLSTLSDYPFFTLTALSQPLQSQRADALYILVFVMLYVMHITLQTGLIAHLMSAMYPKLKGTAPLSLGAMLLLALCLQRTNLAEHPLYGLMILITAFLIPLIFCLSRRFSHEKNSRASGSSVPASADGGMQ